jgi:hypothetical protein
MPRYYLNIKAPHAYLPDLDGIMTSTLPEAMREARKLARNVARKTPGYSSLDDHREFEITDDDENVLATLPFKEAFDP